VKLYRVLSAGEPTWAREEQGTLHLLSGTPFTGLLERGEELPLEGARLLAPAHPTKIVAIGVNYRDHALERGKPVPEEPLLFLKPPSAIIGPGDPIVRPEGVGRVDHEAELALVIGRRASRIGSLREAEACLLGITALNDVTARELQAKDVQFTRAKGFDTFCPVGPCIATDLELGNLAVIGRVNGEVRQKSTTAQLVFPALELIRFVSRVMTLEPGDIISTGTPAGIGPLVPGDVVEIEVEGVGILRNPVQ
jgi:2-keto-4-pentenoate hydratase/2-oxohepta-3-ene-1,7-dioic acid hydratase in catechol pathway